MRRSIVLCDRLSCTAEAACELPTEGWPDGALPPGWDVVDTAAKLAIMPGNDMPELCPACVEELRQWLRGAKLAAQ